MTNAITIANKKLIDLKTVAELLGLKYHTARRLLLNEPTIGFVDFGVKRLWVLDEILSFKERRYRK